MAYSTDLHSRLALALTVALTVALTAPSLASAAYATGDNARTLTHDSELRSYNVYAPPGYDGLSAVPLIVDLHGASSTAAQQQLISGWQTKADEIGALVAYPDGLGNTWNAGVCCGLAAANDVDDVGFIRAMVTAIGAEGNVDAGHVYVTGLSNGGAMTQRLACEAADVFTAAAPLAFPTPYTDFATECTPAIEVPVLLTMGLTDVVIPYENGAFGGAVESFESWRSKNACGPEPSEDQLQVGGSFCEIDTSCASDTQVGLCSVTGSDLDPPLDIYNGHVLYLNDDGIVLADWIWEFFQSGTIRPPNKTPALGVPGLGMLVLGLLGAGRVAARRTRTPRRGPSRPRKRAW